MRAVGLDFFTRLVDGDIPLANLEGDGPRFMANWIAVRTRFFDDFFVNAGAVGIRQAVILAAGLDSRAYRLPWAAGTTVFELDQPKVIEFKTTTMTAIGATPKAHRRTVSVDLREDWPAALRHSGFDESQPTAWSAEGLLAYLPPEAQDRLFDNITALSMPGSQLATEYHLDGGAAMGERGKTMGDHWRAHGFDVDLSELFYPGERSHVVEYLSGHGWTVSAPQSSRSVRRLRPRLPEHRSTVTDAQFACRHRDTKVGEPMARTEGDTWDLASSVGATATGVAASRALATKQPIPLIRDPYADALVKAVGLEHCNKIADGELDYGDDPLFNLQQMCEQIAVRTRFFDDFFIGAASAGIQQAVILASGLDTRAYRLPWPQEAVVFEIDQPQVIEFKSGLLESLAPIPRPIAGRCRSIFAMTGRRRCATTDLIPPSPQPGSPKDS